MMRSWILSRFCQKKIWVISLSVRKFIRNHMRNFSVFIGVYQLKRARSYAEEKCATTDLTGKVQYNIEQCSIIPNLIRVPMKSAHSDRTTYHPTIHFTDDHILGWWCDCYIGSRFLGCCSHISSAIWFLSCERWQAQHRHKPSGTYINLTSDAIYVSDFYDSSDDDDDDNSC